MGKKKPILLSAAALAAGLTPALAQTATDVTSKITDPSFEDDNKAGKWTGDFVKAPNTSLVGIDGSIYYEKWTDSKNKLGNLTEKQTITLPKGYYELTAVGSMLDQSLAEDKQDGAKGFFLKAGDNTVEFGKVGTYCVPFSMGADGDVKIGVLTNNAQGNWARVDNFKLFSYDISVKEYKDNLTTTLAIHSNKTLQFTNDAVLQKLALEASKIQVRINAITMFHGTESVRAQLEKDIEAYGSKVEKAAKNYNAFAAANEAYGNEYNEGAWTPKSPAAGLLALKARLDEQWENTASAVKNTEAGKKLYNDNDAMIAAFLTDAKTAYKDNKAASLFSEGEITKKVEKITASVQEAIKALADGSTNAIQHSAVQTAAENALVSYDNNAKELYSNLVDPNYVTDGATYTDWYTKGLSELNNALRVINKVVADNDALYKEEKCNKESTAEFTTKLIDAINSLTTIVNDYTEKARNWRAWYKAANEEIQTLNSTYKTNIANPIDGLKGITGTVSEPSTSDVKNLFSAKRTEIEKNLNALQEKVDAANKAHTIIATKYDGYEADKTAISNLVNKGTDFEKWVVNAVAEFNANKDAYDKYVKVAQNELNLAKKTVAANVSTDKKYNQNGKFADYEKAIQDKIDAAEKARQQAWKTAVAGQLKGSTCSDNKTATITAVGSDKTSGIRKNVVDYSNLAKTVLGQYNAIAKVIEDYNNAVNGYDTKDKDGKVTGHVNGLDEVANKDVTVDGTLTGKTYAESIDVIKRQISALQKQVNDAVAKINKDHVDAMAALKAIDGLADQIAQLTESYTTNETNWTKAQQELAKKNLLAEAQRRINLLDTEYAVKNEYASKEATEKSTISNVDTFEEATYGKQAVGLNTELNKIKEAKRALQEDYDKAKEKEAADAIPVLSQINTDSEKAQQTYNDLVKKANDIKATFLKEKEANKELNATVQDNLTDYIAGNETKKITALLDLLPENNPNTNNPISQEATNITNEKKQILDDIKSKFAAETLVADRADVKDKDGKVTTKGIDTRISEAQQKINNLRTLAGYEMDNADKSAQWDKDVVNAKFSEKKEGVLDQIQGNAEKGIEASATGTALTYFKGEYDKIATAVKGKYDALITTANTAKEAVRQVYESDGKTTLAGALDAKIYTDIKNNMSAKYTSLSSQLSTMMTDLENLVTRAKANETAHTGFVADKATADNLRNEVFNTIVNAETSSYTETAMKEVLAIDELLKTFQTTLVNDFAKGACDSDKKNLTDQLTTINSKLNDLKNNWGTEYEKAVKKDNQDRKHAFDEYYTNVLAKTYSEQVDIFTKMSKLKFAEDLTSEYEDATSGTDAEGNEVGIYNISTSIRNLKKQVEETSAANELPALWDPTEANLAKAKEYYEYIISKVKAYTTAVNGVAETTWTKEYNAAQGKIDAAKAAIVNLGFRLTAADKKVQNVQAIVDNAVAKHGEKDFAYILANEILKAKDSDHPSFAEIDDKLTAVKNDCATSKMSINFGNWASLFDAEKTKIASFYDEDGTLGAYSEQYQEEVLDKVQATKDFWAAVEKGTEFDNFNNALDAGYNDIVYNVDKTHTVIYDNAAAADQKYHAEDNAYNDAKDLMAGIEDKANSAAEYVASLYVEYNETLASKLETVSGIIDTYNAAVKSAHESNQSATYLETLKGKKAEMEAEIEAVKTKAIELESQALSAEIPALRHDYELATAALITESEDVQKELDKYHTFIDDLSSDIKAIKYATEGKDKDGVLDPSMTKKTAEEARLDYIALEKKMASAKDALISVYAPATVDEVVKAAQAKIDALTSQYNDISSQLADCHEAVANEYNDDAEAFKAAIDALQARLDGYKAEDSEFFYKNNMDTATGKVTEAYKDLSENIAEMEAPYDAFDADKATIAKRHTSLEEKLAAVYDKAQGYEHHVTGYWRIGQKSFEDPWTHDMTENPDCKEFEDYADYVNALLSQEIADTKAALAAEVAPNAINVNSYKSVADGIEKKDGQYISGASKSIENMDGYFAFQEDNGYANDIYNVYLDVNSELTDYAHLSVTVSEVNAKMSEIKGKCDNIQNYAYNLYNGGYSYRDIDGKAYTAETEGAEEKYEGSGEYTLTEDLVLRSPEIISRLKALLEDANALLKKAQENRAIRGYINNDSEVTVSDYTNLAQHIINDNIADYSEREAWAADANADDEINVSDLQKIVNIGTGNFAAYSRAAAYVAQESAANDKLDVQVNENVLSLGITNAVAYTGFQMDITLPSGASVSEESLTERANGQEISVANIGGNTYRVLVMGVDGSAFNGNAGAIVNLILENMHGTAAVSNVIFTDAQANSYKFTLGNEATAINGVEAQQSMTEKIYSVGGQMRGALGRGLNIIKNNGVVKKMMNK